MVSEDRKVVLNEMLQEQEKVVTYLYSIIEESTLSVTFLQDNAAEKYKRNSIKGSIVYSRLQNPEILFQVCIW